MESPRARRRVAAPLAAAAALVLVSAPAATGAGALPESPDPGWVTDGTVEAVALDGTTLFVGGGFTRIAPATGPALVRSAATGGAVRSPVLAGTVYASIPDGAGGWYVAGRIVTATDTVGIARVGGDGTVSTTFRGPSVGVGVISALALDSLGRLYVGGNFTSLGGSPRRSLARLNAATGALDAAWGAGVSGLSGSVGGIAVIGANVYVGGSFTCIGTISADADCLDAGESQRRAAGAVSAINGAAIAGWTPDPNAAVADVVADGGTVYLAGSFGCLESADADCADASDVVRRGLARVSPSTGAALPFRLDVGTPTGGGGVAALALDGTSLIAVGDFECAGWNGDADCADAGEAARSRAVRADRTTGAIAFAWAPPTVVGTARTVAIGGGTVWIGGDFTAVGSSRRRGVAALSPANGALLAPAIEPTGSVGALAVAGPRLLVGGDFAGAGGVPRRNLAAIDLRTGRPTAWRPDPDLEVSALVVANGQLHVGGAFARIAGQVRSQLARFALPGLALAPWSPAATIGDVRALAVGADGTTYVGGSLLEVAGDPQAHLGAIRVDGTAITTFPAANAPVSALALAPDGRTLYVGGSFTELGGSVRLRLGAVPAGGGAPTGFAPPVTGDVAALLVDGDALLVGGTLSQVAGVSVPNLARVRRDDGSVDLAFAAPPSSTVRALAPVAGRIAVGASITLDGRPDGLVLLDPARGTIDPFRARIDGPAVRALAGAPTSLYAGVLANGVAGQPRNGLATWTLPPAILAGATVAAVVRQGESVPCGVSFGGATSLVFAWLRDGAVVRGQTGRSFNVRGRDVGHTLACRATATNIRATTTSTSVARTVRSRVVTRISVSVRRAPGVVIGRDQVTIDAGTRLRLTGRLRGDAGVASRAPVVVTRQRIDGGPVRRIGVATADLAGRFTLTLPALLRSQVLSIRSGTEIRTLIVQVR